MVEIDDAKQAGGYTPAHSPPDCACLRRATRTFAEKIACQLTLPTHCRIWPTFSCPGVSRSRQQSHGWCCVKTTIPHLADHCSLAVPLPQHSDMSEMRRRREGTQHDAAPTTHATA